jgi:UPF0042 nucleotide-binding protein
MRTTRIVIVTGLSGSGKSTALKALEDAGFFCIDNLPVALLPKLLELRGEFGGEVLKLGLVMDLREKDFAERFPGVFTKLKEQGYKVEMIFLEASDESLIRRFSQTRRQHPITEADSVAEKVCLERARLQPVKHMADRVVDTSHYNIHELREYIIKLCSAPASSERMNIQVLSFGYKYGLPHDADLVMDVRFLPNPFYVSQLRQKDGRDPEVSAYVLEREEAREFMDRYLDLLKMLIPLYRQEGKSYLTLAVGCTGGRHRSVAVASALHERLKQMNVHTTLIFRDISQE